MEVLGIDIGFGFTKATNGKEFLMFKSLLGEASDIPFRANLANTSFTENLHVTVDDQTFFVGDFAERQSGVRQSTLDQDMLIQEFAKILALTAAGIFSEKYVPMNVVSGLPVGYFSQYKESFVKAVLGHHTVNYHKADGTVVTRRININRIRMIPQPMGSILNLLMNERGQITDKDLAKKKVGVVDVGFKTTDFIIFDKLQFISRGSRTIDTGISDAFRTIANKIRKQVDVSLELYRLYDPVSKGTIRIRGQEMELAEIRDHVYAQAAGEIANEINQLWADDWDMDTVVLTGGGGMELAKHLQPLIAGNVVATPQETDARLNNVQGYLKFARHLWSKDGDSAEETEEAAE
ncbi:MAG: ParM/StbA family protein [Desulfatibacillum sp.]|nr:ParM/StbA family protein [Desulfatibacillum sp.]